MSGYSLLTRYSRVALLFLLITSIITCSEVTLLTMNIHGRDGSSKPTASQLSGYCWLWCSEIRHPRKESGFWKHPFLYCKNSEALIECVLLLVLSHQCQLPFLSTKVLDFQSRIRLYRKLPVFSKEVRLRRFELLLCGPFSIEVKRFLKGMRWFRWVSVLRNS